MATFEAILGRSWAILEPSWGTVVLCGSLFGAILVLLWPSWENNGEFSKCTRRLGENITFEVPAGHLGAILKPCWCKTYIKADSKTYIKTYIKTDIKTYIKVRGRLSPQASWIRPRTACRCVGAVSGGRRHVD